MDWTGERLRAFAAEAEKLVPAGWMLESFALERDVLEWCHAEAPAGVAATPGWSGSAGIAVELTDPDSVAEPVRAMFGCDVLPSGEGWALDTLTPAEYVELMRPYFAALAGAWILASTR